MVKKYLVNCLRVPIEVGSILCQHLERSSKSAPCHTMGAMGMTGSLNIRSSLMHGTVNEEPGSVRRAAHIP